MVLGIIGVIIFSATLPVTQIALVEMDPVMVGSGRGVVAGIVAAAILFFSRQRLPNKKDLVRIGIVALGVVFGFPLFSAMAMQTVPPSHGGVVLGLLPLLTAACGALVAGERPSMGFWLTGLVGSAAVISYAILDGKNGSLIGISIGDIWLLCAVISAALGYAVGAELSRRLGGWQVICWALFLSLPFLLMIVFIFSDDISYKYTASTWAAFLYVALFSQLIGFFFWYKGLAVGGIARVGQTQLLQPFFTIIISIWLVADSFDAITIIFAVVVVAAVAIGKRMPIASKA